MQDNSTYEVIDSQQRIISISQFVNKDFSFEDRYFQNLATDEQESILNYKFTVYLCSGSDSEKLAWFETINIAGKELTAQALRNVVYCAANMTLAG